MAQTIRGGHGVRPTVPRLDTNLARTTRPFQVVSDYEPAGIEAVRRTRLAQHPARGDARDAVPAHRDVAVEPCVARAVDDAPVLDYEIVGGHVTATASGGGAGGGDSEEHKSGNRSNGVHMEAS